MAEGEVVNVGGQSPQPTPGTAGVMSQVPGESATVSNLASATGGIAGGNLAEPDIDSELFKFKGDDTPLMQLMLHAKKVRVKSPVVEHYMIDEPRSSVVTTGAVTATTNPQFVIPLAGADNKLPRPYGTLLVKDVDGYAPDGKTKTPGKDLMVIVTGHDNTTGSPICRAINGPKDNSGDETCTTPEIPAGTTLILLGNALYETQKKVDPSMSVPQPTEVYLQKRGMNQIVSDYFDAQKKRIPFSKALIAEQAITDFKVCGNRTLYAGRKGHIKVETPEVGVQDIYTSEGVRYQVKKELQHVGKWTIEEFIALAKMVFTGEDVPKNVICLAGKNFLENIQCIDFTKHPEIHVEVKVNKLNWKVTSVHTVFGEFEFKHDPTLDRLKWSNSAFIVAPDRLVHYVLSAEHTATDRVEGEEATRQALLVWDALALKGSCHVWINGEGAATDSSNINTEATHYHFYAGESAPASPEEGCVYYLIEDCPAINEGAVSGTLWQYKEGNWVEFDGLIMAN